MNAIRWTQGQSLLRLFPLIISISFAMDVFVPAIPDMNRFFNTTSATMQATLYIFMLTVALGQLCVGPLADRFGRRQMAIVTACFFLVGSLLAARATSLPILIAARVIQAFGACGTYLLCFIIIRDNFSTHTCARLFSILTGTNAIVASTAPIIGGVLLDITGHWQAGFYFLTLIGCSMVFVTFFYIPHYPYPKPTLEAQTLFSRITQTFSNLHFRKYTLIASSHLLGLYLFCALSPDILITEFHLSPTQYGLWFGGNALTVFLSNMTAAHLTSRFSLEKIVSSGLLIMIFSCVGMLLLNATGHSILKFMLPMLCLTIGIGLSMGAATALALKDFAEHAGTATALLSACQFGLAGLIGVIVAQSVPGALGVAIPVLCFSVLGFISVSRGCHAGS